MKTILYAPCIYRWDKGLAPPTVPDTWYFHWQKNLWEFFERQKTIKVIWKAGPRTNVLYDPISKYKARNIRYSTKKISRELRKADLMFCDYPSTPILDAEKAGVPWICITFFDFGFIRKDIGDKILTVNTPSEGIQNLSKWIRNPQTWNFDLLKENKDWRSLGSN